MRSPGSGLIWLASYPKSGNTWLRLLFANLQAVGREPLDINTLGRFSPIATSRAVFEFHTLLDAALLRPAEIDLLRPLVHERMAASATALQFVKCHDPWRVLDDGRVLLGESARAAIYVVRDVRDVTVSLSHHLGLTIDETVDWLSCEDQVVAADGTQLAYHLGDWSCHVAGWLAQRHVPLCVVRYEDLLADTAGELQRVLTTLQLQVAPDRIGQAVCHAGFAELQRQEQLHGFGERHARQDRFFRQGQAGGWRTTLTAAQVRRLEEQHGAVLQQLGYDLASA